MQSKQSSRIEQSFAVRSIDRSYPERVCLLPLLCLHPRILTQLLTYVTLPSPSGSHSLNAHFKLNNLGRHRCLASLSQTECHVTGSLCRYIHAHPACNPCHTPFADFRFFPLQAPLLTHAFNSIVVLRLRLYLYMHKTVDFGKSIYGKGNHEFLNPDASGYCVCLKYSKTTV